MKKTSIEKIVQFKSCNNNDIANAVLSLSEPLLNACGENNEMKKLIISLAITGWNLSLFSETEENYKTKINAKIPTNFTEENRKIFADFMFQLIKKKRNDFGGFKKGITEHTAEFEKNAVSLEVKTLPIKPM